MREGGQSDTDSLKSEAETIRGLLEAGRAAFTAQDQKAVHELIPQLDLAATNHDQVVYSLARSDSPGSEAVPRALYYRFLKRIVSHMENVLTSVVMPLDRIDYYKQPKS